MSKSLLDELQAAVAGAGERVGPAVVGLGRGFGRGSGVVVEAGKVLTCAHVLRGDEVAVTFGDGRTEHGSVAGADADLDLAVIAVETGDAPSVAWEPERATALGVGAPVLALADPSGRGLRVTFGLVSATGRSFRGPGVGASAARSSTARRSRAAPRAARSWTPPGTCSGSTPSAARVG